MSWKRAYYSCYQVLNKETLICSFSQSSKLYRNDFGHYQTFFAYLMNVCQDMCQPKFCVYFSCLNHSEGWLCALRICIGSRLLNIGLYSFWSIRFLSQLATLLQFQSKLLKSPYISLQFR